jgi:membrane protein
MKILLKSFVDFYKDDGIMLAGALSCFFMLALIPFLLFLAAIFGYLLGHYPEFHEFFLSLVTRLFPQAAREVAQELQSLIHYREVGIVTLTLYGFFSYQLYVSLETAVQHIFKGKASRLLGVSILLSLLAVTLLVAFTILSFGAAWILSLMRPLAEVLPGLKIGMFLAFLSRFVVPVFLMFLMATALYLLLPPRKVPLRHAVLGGVLAAVFLEAAKHGVSFFMAVKIARLGTIYGSLTVIVTLLVWLVYSFSIFLVGAELVRNLGGSANRRENP